MLLHLGSKKEYENQTNLPFFINISFKHALSFLLFLSFIYFSQFLINFPHSWSVRMIPSSPSLSFIDFLSCSIVTSPPSLPLPPHRSVTPLPAPLSLLHSSTLMASSLVQAHRMLLSKSGISRNAPMSLTSQVSCRWTLRLE